MNKKDKILKQVKAEGKARRQARLDLGIPIEHSHVHKTSKKDIAEKARKIDETLDS